MSMSGKKNELTHLLNSASESGSLNCARMWSLIHDDLRATAYAHMRNESPGRTLQATALVNEVWLRLADSETEWADRKHFFGAVANLMREILVDDARRRNRIKRGGDRQRVDFEYVECRATADRREPSEVLAVNEAIDKLRALNPRQADIVVCRYFGGMTAQETADSLGVSLRTVQADSTLATAWLRRALSDGVDG